jgi:hypothetical protein
MMSLMQRAVLALSLVLAAWSPGAQSEAKEKMIQRAQLEEMFAGMRAKAPWDVDGPLLWGYFFNGPDRAALESIGQKLEASGYRRVALRQHPDGVWSLHVEKVEIHSVDSLDKRNAEFYALAREAGSVMYDGMDVGPAH